MRYYVNSSNGIVIRIATMTPTMTAGENNADDSDDTGDSSSNDYTSSTKIMINGRNGSINK